MRNDSGQTLIELLISSALITLTVTGAGWVLHAEWNRAKCEYLVFQKTRQGLNRLSGVSSNNPSVLLTDNGSEITGEGQCGDAVETVRLNRLEWPL